MPLSLDNRWFFGVYRVINMVYISELVDICDAESSFIHRASKFPKIIKLLLGIAVCFATHAGGPYLAFSQTCTYGVTASEDMKFKIR
jgi:hypothetical protein